jgi:MOSC domain-containing protein YiiM
MKSKAWIFQIQTSKEGLPKIPKTQAEVTEVGLEGDRQQNQKVHGGVDRALCLYSLERILALQAEGHPIFPGAMGENLTLAGLDWETVSPGLKLGLGNQVVVEVTLFTKPCGTIAFAFLNNQFNRVSQDEHPGWSRAYARVLKPGHIRVTDQVHVV